MRMPLEETPHEVHPGATAFWNLVYQAQGDLGGAFHNHILTIAKESGMEAAAEYCRAIIAKSPKPA